MQKRAQKNIVVICLENEGYKVSLETAKLYIALRDAVAKKHGMLRVIDESGEDYLYPASFFAAIELPDELHKAVFATVQHRNREAVSYEFA